MVSRQKKEADRGQFVVKKNDLIRKTRYNLTAQQQKIILFAISKITPEDDFDKEYSFDINELAAACGIKLRDGGYYYSDLKGDIELLTKRDWCHMPDGVHMTMSWIGDAKIFDNDARITIRFNPNMKPYLFHLKTCYTRYRLENVLVFKGKYSIRLYEILRSHVNTIALEDDLFEEQEVTLSLNEFRSQFDLEDNYKRWVDIKRYVLDPAVKEINKRANDIHVEYTPMHGDHTRAIDRILFLITPAKPGQQLNAKLERKEILDHQKVDTQK